MQYAKVAEYQRRGARPLPRPDPPRRPPAPTTGSRPPRTGSPPPLLADLGRAAAAVGPVHRPARVRRRRPPGCSAFGAQVDARPVRDQPPHRRPRPGPDRRAGRRLPGQVRHQVRHRHRRPRRQRRTCAGSRGHRASRLAAARAHRRRPTPRRTSAPYGLLGKWAHMLGFRGHFSTKSRRYSVTLGALRRARRRAQALIAERQPRPARTARPAPTSRPSCSPTTTTRPPSSSGPGPTRAPAGPTTARPPWPWPRRPAPANTPRRRRSGSA